MVLICTTLCPHRTQAAVLVKDFLGEWPMLRPMLLVLKLFLQQRELNEVCTCGGVWVPERGSGLAWTSLLRSLLQMCHSFFQNSRALVHGWMDACMHAFTDSRIHGFLLRWMDEWAGGLGGYTAL
eukprot:364193-Chlamydomonas_euryale.AAC.1